MAATIQVKVKEEEEEEEVGGFINAEGEEEEEESVGGFINAEGEEEEESVGGFINAEGEEEEESVGGFINAEGEEVGWSFPDLSESPVHGSSGSEGGSPPTSHINKDPGDQSSTKATESQGLIQDMRRTSLKHLGSTFIL
nr:zinc finger and BTB domain-containing protein 47-like [Salvelinus alpinus]